MRYFSWIVACGAVLAAAGQLQAAAADDIISEATAQRCGLTRAWVTQAQVDPGREPLAVAGALRRHALRPIEPLHLGGDRRRDRAAAVVENGRPARLSQPSARRLWRPGGHRQRLAALRLEPLHGRHPLRDRCRWRAQAARPALSTKRVYVPTASGMIYSYRLDPVADPAKELGKIDPNWANMTEDEKKDAAKQAEEDRRENIRLHQEYVPPLACASNGPGADAAGRHHANPRRRVHHLDHRQGTLAPGPRRSPQRRFAARSASALPPREASTIRPPTCRPTRRCWATRA